MDMIPNNLNSSTNNFDFLRLLAAYFVLISHQFALSGLPEPGIGFQSFLGGWEYSFSFPLVVIWFP